eukprot:Em0019g1181a
MPGKKRSALAVYNDLRRETPRDETEQVHAESGTRTSVEKTSMKKLSTKQNPLEKTPLPKDKKRKVESIPKPSQVEVDQTTTPPSQKGKSSKQLRKKKRASPGKTTRGAAVEDERKSPAVKEGGNTRVEHSSENASGEDLAEQSGSTLLSACGVETNSPASSPPPKPKPSKVARKKQGRVANTKKVKPNVEDKEPLMPGKEQEEEALMEDGSQVDGVSEEGSGMQKSDVSSAGGLETPFYSQFNPELFEDSRVAGNELFQMMIRPIPVEQFYSEVWEKRPLLIKRHKPYYNDGLFSCDELQRILVEHYLEYSVNLDITSYKNGERLTHNPAGRASPSAVWESIKEGCSVRLLNPQTYSESLWRLNSLLQEHFGSFVGANIYLTPANTQGFAPHYDDIEAFVLQLEGKKQWKLYPPRDGSELLPRHSSPNFSQNEIGTPIMDTVLEPGDLLYFPRGTIHQAMSLPDCHSLHVTLSTYQKNTWGDLLEKLVPAALQSAITEDLELRRGLPTDYLQYMGIVSSDMDDQRRTWFCDKVTSLVSKVLQYLPVDAAVDKKMAGNCPLGVALNESCDCGSNSALYIPTEEERTILHLRTGHSVTSVCHRHKTAYLKLYASNQRKCCDPFKSHVKPVTKGIRVINLWMAQQYSTGEVSLVPGQKLCSACRTKVIQMIQPQSLSSSLTEEDIGTSRNDDGSGDSDSDGWVSTNLSSLLVSLGQSPIDQTKIGRKRYCEDKVRGVDEGIRKKLKLGQSKEVEEYQELLEQLKKKFHECSNKPEKLQVLTVLPQSWTLQRIEEEFGTTYHMARLSKKLVSSKTTPNPRPGKTSDAISRMMPGKKDCISIRVNGEKEHVQKRLLLSSMREAYQQFQVDHPDVKIGLTKFVELRPKNVALAGASGTHNVCVCTLHQNAKLMLEGAKLLFANEHIREILTIPEVCVITPIQRLAVNTVQNDDTEECPYCSKVQRLKKLLMDAFDDMGVEEITYKAWVSVDRSQLETLTKCTEDFVDELLKQLSNLRVHDFIAKQQAAFLEETKANLKPGEAVVLGDFSENYSFVIQDAVQGFHWNNDKATIHPFIAYWRPSVTQEGTHNEAQCSSSCNEAQSDATVVSSIEDCLVHDAVSVHLFVKNFLDFLALNIKGLKKVYYFTESPNTNTIVATDNISSFLPPCLTSSEKSSGVWSQGSRWKGRAITDGPKLTANTRVKLLRYGILRMVVDEEGPMIYHTLENTRIYQEKEMAGLAIREADAPAIEQLLTSYPDPIAIDSLAVEEGLIEDKIELCQLLFGQGLLLVVD